MTFARSLNPILAAAALAFTAPHVVLAQTTSPAGAAKTAEHGAAEHGSLSGADRSFVTQAAMGGMAEVQAGSLAREKASNDGVKQFGGQMVDDHGGANAELTKLASEKNVPLPKAPDAAHQAAMKRLQQLSGAQFDREFTRMMVHDHEKTIAAFDKEAKSGHDADIKAFAAKTLPTLRTHLEMAKKVQSSAGASPTASR